MKKRKYFNKLDSWIILLGTTYERKETLFLKDKECKELSKYLMELKKKRNDK